MKNILKQEQYHIIERNGQLFFSLNTEKMVEANAPVRLTSDQLEELDYRELYRAYSPKGRKSKVDPRVLFKVMVYGYQCGIYSSRKLEEACRCCFGHHRTKVRRWLHLHIACNVLR